MYSIATNHDDAIRHEKSYTKAMEVAALLSSRKTNCSNHSPSSACFRPAMSGRAWVLEGKLSAWGYGQAVLPKGKKIKQPQPVAEFVDGGRIEK